MKIIQHGGVSSSQRTAQYYTEKHDQTDIHTVINQHL